MSDTRLFFFAPLSNARGHFRSIKLRPPFKVERWKIDQVIRLWRVLEGIPKVEIEIRSQEQHCFDKHDKVAHVVTGSIDVLQPDKWSVEVALEQSRRLEEILGALERDIRAIRLAESAHITLVGSYWYEMGEKQKPQMISARVIEHPIEHGAAFVNAHTASRINRIIEARRTPLNKEYLQIAWDHWDESFGTYPPHREFVSLMTSLEAMFNLGQTDLRYRIARSMAVLIGETLKDSEYIYDYIKKAYDIRSRILHTGRIDTLQEIWISTLRRHVNAALRKLIELDLQKELVGEVLTRLGFGTADTITAKLASQIPEEDKWWKQKK